jgi:hypothetical protein
VKGHDKTAETCLEDCMNEIMCAVRFDSFTGTVRGKGIWPYTRPRRPIGCETSRLSHILDSLLTYGGLSGQPYAPAALHPTE